MVEFNQGFSIKQVRELSGTLIFKVTRKTTLNSTDSILRNYQIIFNCKKFENVPLTDIFAQVYSAATIYGRVVDYNCTAYPANIIVTFNNFSSASKLHDRGYLDITTKKGDKLSVLCDRPTRQILVRNINSPRDNSLEAFQN